MHQHIEAEVYHKRAWACLREASYENDEARRAILVSAACTWETLAKEIDEAADRSVEHITLPPDDDERWLLIEIVRAWTVKRAARRGRA